YNLIPRDESARRARSRRQLLDVLPSAPKRTTPNLARTGVAPAPTSLIRSAARHPPPALDSAWIATHRTYRSEHRVRAPQPTRTTTTPRHGRRGPTPDRRHHLATRSRPAPRRRLGRKSPLEPPRHHVPADSRRLGLGKRRPPRSRPHPHLARIHPIRTRPPLGRELHHRIRL